MWRRGWKLAPKAQNVHVTFVSTDAREAFLVSPASRAVERERRERDARPRERESDRPRRERPPRRRVCRLTLITNTNVAVNGQGSSRDRCRDPRSGDAVPGAGALALPRDHIYTVGEAGSGKVQGRFREGSGIGRRSVRVAGEAAPNERGSREAARRLGDSRHTAHEDAGGAGGPRGGQGGRAREGASGG